MTKLKYKIEIYVETWIKMSKIKENVYFNILWYTKIKVIYYQRATWKYNWLEKKRGL